jgi:hypothetical protein
MAQAYTGDYDGTSQFTPRYASDFYEGHRQPGPPGGIFNRGGRSRAGSSIMFFLLIGITIAIVLGLFVWLIWYRPAGVTFGGFIVLVLKGIVNVILWPIKFILQVLGLWNEESEGPKPEIKLPDLPEPPIPTTSTKVVKHEIAECPPCTNECVCPTCEETDIRPYELEIKYLKNMAKMVGSIARRENAINSQYRELYPGFSVMSPHVRKISHEYNFIKNQVRQDPEQWQYFKNYFSRITGIPSTSQSVHYDLVL